MGRVRQSESSPPWPGGYESVMILRTESGRETHKDREPTFVEALSILNVTTYYPHIWVRHSLTSIFQMRKQGLRQLSQTCHRPSFGPRADSLLLGAQGAQAPFYYTHKKETSSTGREHLLRRLLCKNDLELTVSCSREPKSSE